MINLKYASAVLCAAATLGYAQTEGPFPPTDWPATANPDAVVHFTSVGDVFAPLGPGWVTGNMLFLSGGDQRTEPITIGGFEGLKALDPHINVADFDYAEWADDEMIDILVQVYGDSALFDEEGAPRDFNFLIGTLPELDDPSGGQIPVEARNRQWNWVLFRIPNTIRESDGLRRVGTIPANAQGATAAGGVNGGTIRLQPVQGVIIRAVAFGEVGAFGEPEQVNLFNPAAECPPEPETNLAFIDLANSQTNHLEIVNSGDQTVVVETDIGPEGDKRRAVRPEGNFMNFGITDNYLGAACNDAKSVKICVEFYDDPALAGVRFGPEAFATDDQGAIGFVPEDQRYTLTGSGNWERIAWTVPSVSLYGVNTAPLTAGPRLTFDAPVFISQFSLGVLRTGTHPLAGQDPLPDCFQDPNFCEGVYGTTAEFDLQNGILDGLAPGTSGGDQEMIQEEAGPEGDRRMAVRPASNDGTAGFRHQFLNFAINDEKLGPSSQPGVTLAICMTYYDDPALAGATIRPEVYQSDRGGTIGFAFPPAEMAVALEGTGTWHEGYFELTDVKFIGVNQGPQAAARFAVSDIEVEGGSPIPAKIAVSQLRYGVIRPCGPDAGVNPLEECKPAALVEIGAGRNIDGSVRITWPAAEEGYVLQESNVATAEGPWTEVSTAPVVEGELNVVTVTPTGTKFFRLVSTATE